MKRKGKSKTMATEQQAEELYAKFQDTEEMLDWDEFVTQTKKVLATNPAAETVTIPAAFLRRVILDIGASPLMFSPYRDRFNQLCDELGMPEEKQGEPAPKNSDPQAKPEGEGDGPF